MYDIKQIGPVVFSNSSAYRSAQVSQLFEGASTRDDLVERAATASLARLCEIAKALGLRVRETGELLAGTPAA